MNILFLINSLNNGGAEKVVATIASKLCDTFGANVWIAVDDISKSDYEVSSDVNIISLKKRDIKGINKLFTKIITYRRIKAIKRRNEIDCSISFLPIPNLYNVLTKVGEKCITSVRVMMKETEYPWYYDYLHKFSMKKSDKVVAVSECVEREIIRTCSVESVRILNPCDLDAINKRKMEMVSDEIDSIIEKAEFVLITHGRLDVQKGQAHLIKIMSEIVKKRPTAVLLICGEGNLRIEYERLIKAYHLKDNVYLLGMQENPYAIINRCDIYVFSSLYEGFPNALLDAMAVGLPIISADGTSGIRELLAPNTDCEYCTENVEYASYGILTPRFSKRIKVSETLNYEEKQMYDAIEELMSSKEKREFYRNQSLIRIQDFLVEKITRQWWDVINSC